MNDRDATADWLLSTQGRIARIVAGSLLIIIGRSRGLHEGVDSGRRRGTAAGPQPHPPKRDRSAWTFATYCFVSSKSPRERTEPRPW